MPFVELYCFEKKKNTVWVNQRNQSHDILMIVHVCWARIGRTERDMNNSHKTSMVFPSRKRLNYENGGGVRAERWAYVLLVLRSPCSWGLIQVQATVTIKSVQGDDTEISWHHIEFSLTLAAVGES